VFRFFFCLGLLCNVVWVGCVWFGFEFLLCGVLEVMRSVGGMLVVCGVGVGVVCVCVCVVIRCLFFVCRGCVSLGSVPFVFVFVVV